ncbi:MAG: cupin domain-containing protein [Candidatus Dormibacteraceae bacterium]
MRVRRVVTGQTVDGKSVFVSDQQVDPTTVSALPGAEFCRLWGSDDRVSLPADGTAPTAPMYFPPVAGFRFVVVTVGPDRVTMPEDLDVPTAIAELRQKLPGVVEAMQLDNPGMHTTNSVDFGLVLSGEVWLELDAGAEVHLRAGDCVIQNGTRHAWRNKSSVPCVLAFALVGADRASR